MTLLASLRPLPVVAAVALAALSGDTFAQSAKIGSLSNDIKGEYAYRQTQIADKCGGVQIPIEVDFASFGDDADALQKVPQHGLKEVETGFRRFCTNSSRTTEADAAHVAAVKAKVKKIVIRNVTSPAQKKVSLDGDTVVVAMAFATLPGHLSQTEIQKALGEVL